MWLFPLQCSLVRAYFAFGRLICGVIWSEFRLYTLYVVYCVCLATWTSCQPILLDVCSHHVNNWLSSYQRPIFFLFYSSSVQCYYRRTARCSMYSIVSPPQIYYKRRFQWRHGLRRGPACWERGIEYRRGQHTTLMSVVCCQVEVSATGWSLVQRSPTECGVSNGCDHEAPLGGIMTRNRV